MKKIPLTQGRFAIVDDDIFEGLSACKWHVKRGPNTFYAGCIMNRRPDGATTLMHRLIMNAQKGQQVDHIDGNGLNNIKSNLRFCTSTQNKQNGRSYKNSTSKYKGVSWHRSGQKWQARIRLNGKQVYIGVFNDEAEAARAYDCKAEKLFGEFARLNFKKGE